MLKTDNLNINDFILKEDIGEGNFGKVKLCTYKPTGEEYAIKILNKEKIKDKMKNTFFKENEIAQKFNHINVIYVFKIFEDQENCYLVMECCKEGELFDYIVKKQRLTEEEASNFFYQIINGLEHIHNKGIAHRDLKPENLLLTNDKILKIIDFGLSHEFNGNDLLKTKCGSPSYAAPEIICCPYYDGFKTDIWCCGIILYAMLCGFLPFEGDDNTLLFRNILECDPEMPDWLSRTSRDLITRILNPDPDERITLEEIKKHKFYLKGKKCCEINYDDINNIINSRAMINNNKQNIKIEEDINNKKDEINLKNEENNGKKYIYKYCNTISGNLLKIKPFNKVYNIKNNNSINSFRKKIIDINLNFGKKIDMLKNNGQINNKNKLNNEKNNNYNSINSSNNLINKDNKFSSFLSRLNSYRKPLFLKIISSSIKNDTNKKNEFENKMDFLLNNNIKENETNKKYISFLQKMKNNFRNYNQHKKLINNYLYINTISYTNRVDTKNGNKKVDKNVEACNNNNFRDKLYTKLYSSNVNTPINIKKNKIPISTELNQNHNKKGKINKINNTEPKPIVYCSNLNININNININNKTNNNTLSTDKKKTFGKYNNSTKASSSKRLSLKIRNKKQDKNSKSKTKSNTIKSQKNKSNELFFYTKSKENPKTKVNLSNIIQKRLKNNKEKKNLINLYSNVKHITENTEKNKNKINNSEKKIKNNNKRNIKYYSKNNYSSKNDKFLRIFNGNNININNLDNIDKKFLTMFNNHSRSSKKLNKNHVFK